MKVTRACVTIVIALLASMWAFCGPEAIQSLPVGGRPYASFGKLVAWNIGEGASSRIALEWSKEGVKRHQVIQLPTPWYCNGYKDDTYRPVGIQFQFSDEPWLMVVANRQSGVYDVRSPIFYRLHKGTWTRVASNPKESEFSNFGSCCINNGRLYTWDCEMAAHKGHGEPQRYLLRVFSISRTRIRLRLSKVSRMEYDSLGDSIGHFTTPSSQIRPDKDPMREFGLRWKWWGDV